MTDWTDAQQQTVAELSPMGFHLDEGEPCKCGADAIETTKNRGYSDFMTYTHSCTNCGNEFSTYIEG